MRPGMARNDPAGNTLTPAGRNLARRARRGSATIMAHRGAWPRLSHLSHLPPSSPDLLASAITQTLEAQSSFSQPSFDPGETAVFHVADSGLDTLFSCTATWVDADPGGDDVGRQNTYWNIFTGEPAPSAYQGFDSGCAFVSTSTTPLEDMPDLGEQSRAATVNGVETSIAEFYADGEFAGDAALNIDVRSTSTVAIPFYFHAQNSYAGVGAAGTGDERGRPDGRVGGACGGGEHYRQRRGGQVRRVQGLGRAEGGR